MRLPGIRACAMSRVVNRMIFEQLLLRCSYACYGSQPGVVITCAARLFIPHKLTVEERTQNGASGIHSTFPVDCSVHHR